MKTLSQYLKLNLIIIALISCNNTYLYVEDLRGERVNIGIIKGAKEINFVIFYGPYSCYNCFRTLETSISKFNLNGYLTKVIVLIRSGNSTISKRRDMGDAKRIFKKPKNYYFDIHEGISDTWPPKYLEGGLFGKFNVDITPALLILHSDYPYEFFSYNELFDTNGRLKIKTFNQLK